MKKIFGFAAALFPAAVLAGCSTDSIRVMSQSPKAVSICLDPAKHKESEAAALARRACAAHGRTARPAATGRCGRNNRVFFTCVK